MTNRFALLSASSLIFAGLLCLAQPLRAAQETSGKPAASVAAKSDAPKKEEFDPKTTTRVTLGSASGTPGDAVVVPIYVTPVETLVALTAEPGRTAPLESLTVPTNAPGVPICATSGPWLSRSEIRTGKSLLTCTGIESFFILLLYVIRSSLSRSICLASQGTWYQ